MVEGRLPSDGDTGWSATQPASAAKTAAPTVPLAHPLRIDLAETELRPLLRRRLIVFLSLGVWGFGVYVVGRQFDLAAVWANQTQRILFPISVAVLAVSTVALTLLVLRPGLSVARLRIIELVALVAGCGQAAFQTFDPIPDFILRPEASTFGANNDIFLWFVVITLYGVLIPNTLRRAALVAGTMTAVAAASMLLAWSRYGLPMSMWILWFTNLVAFLGVAAGMTVFNSARLDLYRREAAAARELGQYRLGRRLGGGGMGEVFLAEHRLLKRPCAVKLIRGYLAADPIFVKRFAREVEAATRLTHPAAVQVFDFGQAQDGTCYYVMEYLPGLTLEEIVRRTGSFPPGRVIHVLRQVCGALDEAHALGLVHRDVKPGNIMLCRLGGRPDAAKLLDFGIVAETGQADTRITQVGGTLGTPAYMSPEQASGGIEVGPASDLYSLGAVACFLLTGKPPSFSSNLRELLRSPATPSSPRTELAPDLEAVILRLLSSNPGDRYASAAEVSLALASCHDASQWTKTDAMQWWEHVSIPDPGLPST